MFNEMELSEDNDDAYTEGEFIEAGQKEIHQFGNNEEGMNEKERVQ